MERLRRNSGVTNVQHSCNDGLRGRRPTGGHAEGADGRLLLETLDRRHRRHRRQRPMASCDRGERGPTPEGNDPGRTQEGPGTASTGPKGPSTNSRWVACLFVSSPLLDAWNE